MSLLTQPTSTFLKLLCYGLCIVFFSSTAFSAEYESSAAGSGSGSGVTTREKRGPIVERGRDSIYSAFALKLQYGKGGSENSTSVVSRDLFNHGFQADLGMNWKEMIFGLSAEYNSWKQIPGSSPSDGSNISGTILNVMPTIGYRYTYNYLSAFLKYIAYSKYSLVQTTANGYSSSYSSPSSGYQVQMFYHHTDHSRIGVEYTSLKLQRSEVGSVETELSSGAIMNFSSFGMVYLWEF